MDTLPLGPKPIVRASAKAPILIAGQAPGTKAHASGLPFDDLSGDRLRDWLGVDRNLFYDTRYFSFVPMGFCYPGRMEQGRGDAPPDPRCQHTWHDRLIPTLKARQLTIVMGRYALDYHLGGKIRKTESLVSIVQRYQAFLPEFLPLPHPSPRNLMWFRKNPWFEADVIPALRARVQSLLGQLDCYQKS